jgi:CRP-like cAMP-binding protein
VRYRLPNQFGRGRLGDRLSSCPKGKEPMPQPPSRSANRVLARLSRADFALLKPHLEPVDLPVLTPLEAGNSRIDAVYFIEQGFASVVANGPGKRDIEVGLIGREGMTGLAIVLGHDRCRNDTYIQVAGAGQCISADILRQAIVQSVSLHHSLLRCAHVFLVQTTETAVANGRSKNEERLARWLLMADDRIDGGEVPLTHKLLGIMLGVQRPAVTVALKVLEREGLVKAGQRVITIRNRKGLIKFAKGAYVQPENH